MSVPEFRRALRWLPWFVAVLAVAQCVMFMLLIPLLREQGERSAQGRQARVVQCEFRPMTLREQEWFQARGVITAAELAKVRRALPSEAQCRALSAEK